MINNFRVKNKTKFKFHCFYFNFNGQSMIEIVVALGIFAILISTLFIFSLQGLMILERSSYYNQALAYLNEGEEAVRSIQKTDWNSFSYAQSAIATSTGKWSLAGEGSVEDLGNFSRSIYFFDVYRNDNNIIVEESDLFASRDYFSKYADIRVNWQVSGQKPIFLNKKILLSHYDVSIWKQIDWQGSDGQDIWIDESKYLAGDLDDSTSGELKLSLIASSSYATEGYMISSAFNTGQESSFTVLSWDEAIPEDCFGCEIKMQIKTALDLNGVPGTWTNTWSGPDGDDGDENDYYDNSQGNIVSLDHNNDQWIRYKIILFGIASSSPVLNRVNIYYQ